jgi:hypothetical protein
MKAENEIGGDESIWAIEFRSEPLCSHLVQFSIETWHSGSSQKPNASPVFKFFKTPACHCTRRSSTQPTTPAGSGAGERPAKRVAGRRGERTPQWRPRQTVETRWLLQRCVAARKLSRRGDCFFTDRMAPLPAEWACSSSDIAPALSTLAGSRAHWQGGAGRPLKFRPCGSPAALHTSARPCLPRQPSCGLTSTPLAAVATAAEGGKCEAHTAGERRHANCGRACDGL